MVVVYEWNGMILKSHSLLFGYSTAKWELRPTIEMTTGASLDRDELEMHKWWENDMQERGK